MHERDCLAREVLLLALIAGGSCSGAPTVTSHYDNGRLSSTGGHVRELRSGPWTDYFPNGGKQCEGSYENDVQTGLWTYWFENGNKEMEGRFENERREDAWTSWYENGALRAVGRFEGGFEEGSWRFYDRSGAIEHEGTFELGRPVLRWTYFHPDGTERETGHCHAGARVGAWTTQDAAGNRTETIYPIPAGCELVEERFADSTLKRAGFLRDGVPAGRWNSFHSAGKLRLECTFRDGAPDGSARAWREDGSMLASGRLKDGCVIGKWVFTRDGVQEERESKVARPRPSFGGDWSPAGSADLPGWMAVETWVAEMGSPRQPAPIPPAVPPQSSAPASNLALDDPTGIPARAQPWTEYERRVLPDLVKLYGTGSSEYEGPPALRKSRSRPAAAVATPADLIGRTLPLTRFSTADGEIDLEAFMGKQNVLVTILRGFGGQVCVYCTAQTKALADFADRFAALDTKVVVVFPGPASGLAAFREAYRRTFGAGEKLPYELLYDTDLTLTRALHIEDNIAVPTSLLLDRKGIIRWCRVAKDHADRPSAQEILAQIAALPKREH
jgi:antitoxin component YwqK of YwqJK toxin-antitoxin module/peroxiredoxin